MKYWLLKSEPNDYSITDMQNDNITAWDGVRNYQARNNMMQMQIGDLAFFYHSVSTKKIMGIVKVTKEHYPDPSDSSGKFVCVDITFSRLLKNPVSLAAIKENPALEKIALVKQSRLSVMPVSKEEWEEILLMSE